MISTPVLWPSLTPSHSAVNLRHNQPKTFAVNTTLPRLFAPKLANKLNAQSLAKNVSNPPLFRPQRNQRQLLMMMAIPLMLLLLLKVTLSLTTTTEGQTESTTTTEGQTEFTTTAEGQTEFTTTTEGQTESTTEDSPDVNTEDSVKSTTEDDSDATVEDRAVSTSNKDAMYRRFPDKSDMISLTRRPSQLLGGHNMLRKFPELYLTIEKRSAEPSMVDLKQRSSQSTTEPPMQDKSSNSNRRANKSDMASLKRRPSQLMAGKRMRNRMPLQSILIRHLRSAEPSMVDLKQRSSQSTTEPPMQDKNSNSNRRANKSDMASLKRRPSQLMAGKRMRNRMPLQSILIRHLRSAEPSMVDLKQRSSKSTTEPPMQDKSSNSNRRANKSDMASLKRRPSQLMAGKRMRNRMPLQSILIRYLRSAEPSMVDLKQRASESTTEPPIEDGIDLSPGSNTDVGALDPATKAEMDYPEHSNV